MTVALTAIVRDEETTLPRSLPTFLPLIDSWQILDTGSEDGTADVIADLLGHLPGELHHAEWTDFGTARNQLLALCEGKADWLLTMDADMTLEFRVNPGVDADDFTERFRPWLAADPQPEVDAWMMWLEDGIHRWRRPCLIRSSYPWEYRGVVHEYLDTSEAVKMNLLGLELSHFGKGSVEGKFERYIELLKPEAEAGDPRSMFYLAESYRFAGMNAEAAGAYELRAQMGSWEEEAWYAAYRAALLRDDVPGLLAAYERRPWRHEPLSAAARIVSGRGSGDDFLFLES